MPKSFCSGSHPQVRRLQITSAQWRSQDSIEKSHRRLSDINAVVCPYATGTCWKTKVGSVETCISILRTAMKVGNADLKTTSHPERIYMVEVKLQRQVKRIRNRQVWEWNLPLTTIIQCRLNGYTTRRSGRFWRHPTFLLILYTIFHTSGARRISSSALTRKSTVRSPCMKWLFGA